MGDHTGDYNSADLVQLGPNLPHTWFSRKTERSAAVNEAIVVQFLESAFPKTLLELPEFESVRSLLLRSAMGVRFSPNTATRLEKRVRALTKADGFEAWLRLARLLHELSQTGGETLVEPSYRKERAFKMGSRLGKIIDHIESHSDEEFSLGDAARFANLTPSSFARFFRKKTGKTFVDFRNGCRIGKACQRLVESDQSILEIALISVFGNLANFNSQFRKSIGMTPRDYRKLRNPN